MCFLSIVVCTHNRADLLPGCIASLAKQTLSRERFEVLVVDNDSTDATPRILARLSKAQSNVRWVREEERGLAAARNRGWQEARGRYVAYVDDDARPKADWAERVVGAFGTTRPIPVAVGGKITPWYESPPPSWFPESLEIRTHGDEAGFLVPAGRVFPGEGRLRSRWWLDVPTMQTDFLSLWGSNMAIERRVLDRVGGFDTRRGMRGRQMRFAEEREIFLRIYELEPFLWFDPAICVTHLVGPDAYRLGKRFARAFNQEAAAAQLVERKRLTGESLRLSAKVAKRVGTLPFRCAMNERPVRATLLLEMREIGGMVGYLLAQELGVRQSR